MTAAELKAQQAAQQVAIDAAEARLNGTLGGSNFTPEQLRVLNDVEKRIGGISYDVLKTLPDGSKLLQFSDPSKGPRDGTMQVLNEEAGLASSEPDIVNAAIRGESPVEAEKQKRAGDILSQKGAMIGAKGATFLKGLPFIGSRTDELIGQTPREESQIRGLQSAFNTQRPSEAIGLQVAGGIAGGSALGLSPGLRQAGTALISKIQSLPRGQKILSYLGMGAVLGGTEAGVYATGEGKDPAQAAILGGGTSAAVTAALPIIGGTLARGFANFKTVLERKDLTNISTELGISKEAAKVIQSAVQQTDTDLADMLAAIDRAGDQGMIADADIATQVLLDAVGAAEGGAAAATRQAVDSRAKEVGQNLQQTMDSTVAPRPVTASGESSDVRDIASDIASQTRPQRKEAYNQAYSQAINYTSDAGRKIESIIDRIPSRTLSKAIDEANDQMKAEGMGQRQIRADIADDGSVIFTEMPNVIQLDYIKRSLGSIGQEVDNFKRPTQEAGRANSLYRDLSEALGEAVPSYKEAVRLGGDKIGRDKALQIGEDALKANVTARDVARALLNLDEGQRQFARIGLRDAIERTLDNVKATISSPDIDIKQTSQMLKDLSSPANRAKVKAIIGSSNSKKLFRELEKANAALQLRASVAVNSKTAIRSAVQSKIDELIEPGAIDKLSKGEPIQAVKNVMQAISGATDEYTGAQKSQIMREIARAITAARGKEAKRQLKVVYDAVKENRANQDQIDFATNIMVNQITLPTAIFGVQSATRDIQK